MHELFFKADMWGGKDTKPFNARFPNLIKPLWSKFSEVLLLDVPASYEIMTLLSSYPE